MTMAIRDEDLFEATSTFTVLQHIGLGRRGASNVSQNIIWVVLIGWAPLVILAALQGLTWRTDGIRSLISDTGVHARYLIAAPLFIVAEARYAPQLNVVPIPFIAIPPDALFQYLKGLLF